jgi:hypothetical protein
MKAVEMLRLVQDRAKTNKGTSDLNTKHRRCVARLMLMKCAWRGGRAVGENRTLLSLSREKFEEIVTYLTHKICSLYKSTVWFNWKSLQFWFLKRLHNLISSILEHQNVTK